MNSELVEEDNFEKEEENVEGGGGGGEDGFSKGGQFRKRRRFRDFTIPFGKVITRLRVVLSNVIE